MVEALDIELRRTFLDDVEELTGMLYRTVQNNSSTLTKTSNLESTLRSSIPPENVPSEIIDYNSFIRLCVDYLTAHPFEQTLQDPSASQPVHSNGTLKRLAGVMETVREEDEYNRQKALQAEVDQEISTLELVLKRTLQCSIQIAAQKVGVESALSPDAMVSQCMRTLQQDFYRQKGIRNHENPELMEQLSFRALALKKGWINCQGNNYVIAKSGKDLLPELHEARITADIFEQYTSAKITSAVATPVGSPVFTVGIPAGISTDFTGRNIIVMGEASTWARGYHNLRAIPVSPQSPHPTVIIGGKTVYRPLTLGENLRARIEDAYAHNDKTNSYSWNIWNDSCTSIVYGPRGRFKVQRISPHLLNLGIEFREPFVQVRYDDIKGEDVMEFDQNEAKYNTTRLTLDEFMAHPFWKFIEPNENVRAEYARLQRTGTSDGVINNGVDLQSDPTLGELRALYLYLNKYSYTYGSFYPSNGGSFLLVSRSPTADSPFAVF